MTTAEIYSAAFELYRRHFRPLMIISIIYTALLVLINFLNRPGLLPLGRAAGVVTEFVQIYIYAVVVVAASNAVLARPVRVSPAFQRAAAPRALIRILLLSLPLPLATALFRAFVPAMGLSAQQTSNITLFVLLIGFVVRILFLFAAPVIVLEKRGLVDTVRRAFQLSAAFAGPNFYRYGLFFVPFQILRAIVSGIFAYGALLFFPAQTISSLELFLLQQIPLALLILFLNPFGNLVATLLYYDARARREGYHHEVLAEEMGYQPITEMIAA